MTFKQKINLSYSRDENNISISYRNVFNYIFVLCFHDNMANKRISHTKNDLLM